MKVKKRNKHRKQDRRTQIRILTEQGHWDPVGALNRIKELSNQAQKERRDKKDEDKI